MNPLIVKIKINILISILVGINQVNSSSKNLQNCAERVRLGKT